MAQVVGQAVEQYVTLAYRLVSGSGWREPLCRLLSAESVGKLRIHTEQCASEETVTYIVEVKDKTGSVARKEYEARSLREALLMAESELEPYPQLYINDIWPKGSPIPGLFGTRIV